MCKIYKTKAGKVSKEGEKKSRKLLFYFQSNFHWNQKTNKNNGNSSS